MLHYEYDNRTEKEGTINCSYSFLMVCASRPLSTMGVFCTVFTVDIVVVESVLQECVCVLLKEN